MVIRVAATHTVVHPDAVRLVSVRALVASLAMLRPGRFNDLAVGAELITGQLLEQLTELEHVFLLAVLSCRLLISGEVARLSFPA